MTQFVPGKVRVVYYPVYSLQDSGHLGTHTAVDTDTNLLFILQKEISHLSTKNASDIGFVCSIDSPPYSVKSSGPEMLTQQDGVTG